MTDEQHDLDQFFEQAVVALPQIPDESRLFSAQSLPVPPTSLTSDRIGIEVGRPRYGEGFMTELISFGAPKDTYRALALLILCVVFHREPETVEIHLTHPETKVSWLQVSSTFPDPDTSPDYQRYPGFFRYWSQFHQGGLDADFLPYDLPWANYCHRSEPLQYDPETRDVVKGFGNDNGAVLLAELLLNVGLPGEYRHEPHLRGPVYGDANIAPTSHEMRFFVPGDNFYFDPSVPVTEPSSYSATFKEVITRGPSLGT
jgi:hypothetical protein